MNNYQKESMVYKIVNEFSKTIEMFNLSTSDARLFAFLYLNESPLTLDEMSDALGKSKTTVSTSARNLVDSNLATLVWQKGVRKDLYQANSELFKSFMNASVARWIDYAGHQRNALEKLKEMLHDEGTTEQLETPLKDIIEFHQDIEKAFQKMKGIE